MTISAKTSTEELIKQVMEEHTCGYEEAIRLLMKVAQNRDNDCLSIKSSFETYLRRLRAAFSLVWKIDRQLLIEA